MKSKVWVIVLTLLLVTPLWATNDISMDGLIETETVSVVRTNQRYVQKVDIERLDKDLKETDQLLVQVADKYKTIFNNADRDEKLYFRTWDLDQYKAMRTAAVSFASLMKQVEEKLTSLQLLFGNAAKEPLEQEIHRAIWQRAGHFIRNITVYNCYCDFGLNRDLLYETIKPFNELRVKILKADRIGHIDFPPMYRPQMQQHIVGHNTENTREGIVLESSTVAITDVVLHLPFDQDSFTKLLKEAQALAKKAARYKEELLAAGVKEIPRSPYNPAGTNSIEYRGDLSLFHNKHQPKIVEFVISMVTLKGYCNELTARLRVSNNYVNDLNLRCDLQQTINSFQNLCKWGDGWVVTYDAWNKWVRWFKFFPGRTNFARTHIYQEMKMTSAAELYTQAVRQRQQEAMRQSGMLSTDDVIKMLKTLKGYQRLARACKLANRIYDLDSDNVVRIGKCLASKHRDEWITFVSKLPNLSGV